MLVAAADGAIMGGTRWATPPMLDGGKWSRINRNGFQQEKHLECPWRRSACPRCEAAEQSHRRRQLGYEKNDDSFPRAPQSPLGLPSEGQPKLPQGNPTRIAL